MNITLPRATVEQALEALEGDPNAMIAIAEGHWDFKRDLAIDALRAALAEDALDRLAENERALGIQMEAPRATLAQQAEPVKFWPLAPLTGYYDVGGRRVWLEKDDPFPVPAPPQRKPLTIERLRDALVASRIIPPAAVEDPDEYDDGVTLHRIEALHRRIT